MADNDVIFLNNCQGRNHAQLFGQGAFFDLYISGYQSKKAINLPKGQECVVASYSSDGRVNFDWYAFAHELVLPDDKGDSCRALFGYLLFSETISKEKAASSARYSDFFKINGDFKGHSVIDGKVAAQHRVLNKQVINALASEELAQSSKLYAEGTTTQITINAYERNPAARAACIQHHGAKCCICSFDFGVVYGSEVQGFIHVHHLKPLSEIKASYEVDPIADLRPVCPNCHSIIHLGGTTRSIEDVKALLKASTNAV